MKILYPSLKNLLNEPPRLKKHLTNNILHAILNLSKREDRPRGYKDRKEEKKRMVHHVKVIESGEIVKVYFYHKDGVAYVGENGIKILFKGEYEEIEKEGD